MKPKTPKLLEDIRDAAAFIGECHANDIAESNLVKSLAHRKVRLSVRTLYALHQC